MLALTPRTTSFVYRKTKPFSKAEFKFKTALADYAGGRLLAKLRSRTAALPGRNQYTGINVRVTADAVFLEAILTNEVEWGGFGFDFVRLIPANNGRYNVSLRRSEDWARAENSTVAAASNYFLGGSIFPRASDWELIARGKTFEECIELVERHQWLELVPVEPTPRSKSSRSFAGR